MKLALECTPKLLSLVQPLGDYAFVQSKRLQADKAYAEFYQASDATKFLLTDGEPTPTLEALKFSKSLLAVVPQDKVLELSKALHPSRIVGILSGSTPEEVLKLPNSVDTRLNLAVPYDICAEKGDTLQIMAYRRALIIKSIPAHHWVMLLGFSHIDEFQWYSTNNNVLVTGVPVLLGLQDRDIVSPLQHKNVSTLDQMTKLDGKINEKQWAAICRNIALLRKYLV